MTSSFLKISILCFMFASCFATNLNNLRKDRVLTVRVIYISSYNDYLYYINNTKAAILIRQNDSVTEFISNFEATSENSVYDVVTFVVADIATITELESIYPIQSYPYFAYHDNNSDLLCESNGSGSFITKLDQLKNN